MSGLFGIASLMEGAPVQDFLEAAQKQLIHLPWQTSQVWLAPGGRAGFGRLNIGIFNRETQPVSSPDGAATLVFSGEVHNLADLRRKLTHRLVSPHPTAAEWALLAYERFGEDFAEHLEGAFFVCVYDRARGKLVLANDRFGLYPHYYHYERQTLTFSPEVKGVLCAAHVQRKLDLSAMSEYFRFQQVLGEKTFHEGVRLFPYGSVGSYDVASGEWRIRRYWDFDRLPERPRVSFKQAVAESGELLRSAVQRLAGDELRPGVFLSGGLDSRTLLGMIPPRAAPPVSATFGARNSRDVYYAGKIARSRGSRHFWFEFTDGCWVQESLDLHLKLTEGFHSWIHMHGITMLNKLREVMDYNLTGWDGGTVMGHSDHINAIYNFPVDQWTVVLRTFHMFNQAYTWPGLTEAEERLLYTPEYRGQAVGRAFDSMLAEFAHYWQFRKEYAAEYFYIANHCWRSTQQMVTMIRSHLEVRFPFWDYALIDYMYSLPPALRRDQILYRHIITEHTPTLALIPYDKQEHLPTVNPWLHNPHSVMVRGLRRLGLYPNRPTLYADYEQYLRTDLRQMAEDVLFDKRTVQRGIVDPAFVRSLMARHIAGRELWTIGKIAPLITFELMMREYFD